MTDDIAKLLSEDKSLLEELTPWGKVLKNFLTVYPPLIELKTQKIPRLCAANIPVLILGETGTGKEMIARSLHGERKGPFVKVSSCCIPLELLESEFFGCVKGAFTGANRDRDGFIKEADGGTLFLDEIGDMPPILQAKLLVVLQDKCYRRVGDTKEMSSNFRLITATNHFDLLDNENIHFRDDLYYRIAGSVIKLPNLHKRGHEDIKLIVEHFCENEIIREKIFEELQGKNLRGNVRELINIIEEHKVMMI